MFCYVHMHLHNVLGINVTCCNGLDQRVARQQLCEHGPNAAKEAVFSGDPTDAPIDWLDNDHVTYVYCRSMSIKRLYNESRDL
jgi:hypothetical protein